MKIKLTSAFGGTGASSAPARLMLDEISNQYPANPLNGREVLIGSAKVEVALVGDDAVLLKSVESMGKGAGHGTAALQTVLALADQFKVGVELFAVPFGPDGLNEEELASWYSRHGFTSDGSDHFTRTYIQSESVMENKQEPTVATPPFSVQDFPTINGALSERRQAGLKKALDAVNAGLAAKQIANPVFKDVKDSLNWIVGDSYQDIVGSKVFYPNRPAMSDELNDLAWVMVSSLHDCKSATKKFTKSKLVGPEIDAMRAYMAEIAPLVKAVDDLKEMIVKRVILSPEERAEAERFVPPKADAGVTRVVYEALDAITKKHYEELVSLLRQRMDKNVARFLAADEETRAKIMRDPYSNEGVLIALERVSPRSKEYRRIPDADAQLQIVAERDARRIQEGFISKNLRKLASVVDQKGDFSEIIAVDSTVSISGLRGRLHVSFKDGAKFTVENSVVQSYSIYNKPFLRYPLTFHDVYFGDGTRMSGPSEEKMNTLFAKGAEPTAEELARDAAGRFADGEPGALGADAAKWGIDEHYPLSKLGDVNVLKDRFIQQCAKAEEDGEGNLYEDMIGQPIRKPVVILVQQGKPFVWDGDVRVGAAARNGEKTIRAAVGIPRVELEKNLSAESGVSAGPSNDL